MLSKQKGKTIIIIGSFELPDKNAAAHRVIANGKAFRDLGYNVVFIGATKRESAHPQWERKVFFGFDCYEREKPSSGWEWLKYLVNIQIYKEIIDKYEDLYAIIGYNLPALLGWNLKKLGKRMGYKIYADSTEWYEIKKKGNSLINFLIRYADVYFRMRVLNPKLDGVIAISNYLYEFYSKKGTKTIKIPPLVDISDEKWKNNLQLQLRPVQLLYAGTPFSLYSEPSYKDRIDWIIEALYQLRKKNVLFQFHVFGIKREEIERNFPNLKDALLFLDDSLIFYGVAPHLIVIAKLKSVDYSLFLRHNSRSTKAGFPTKFVESFSCGIPVLTNENSNVTDYLKDGVNGWVIDSTSKDSVEASLKRALSITSEAIFEMKNRCYDSKTFDYHNYLDSFKTFFEC